MPILALTPQQRRVLSHEQQEQGALATFFLVETIKDIEGLLTEVVLASAVQNAAESPLRHYREEILSQRSVFDLLLSELIELYTGEPDDLSEAPPADPIAGILETGLDFWEGDEYSKYSEEEVARARRLVQSDFFRPDEWLGNAEKLQPVSGTELEQRLPSAVRIRLRELYRSFVLGNHLATISLARTILEYCIHDRASTLGIKLTTEDYARVTDKRLSHLATELSSLFPELHMAIDEIVESGNRVMHPRKRMEKVTLHPETVRRTAFNVIEDIRLILESIYRKNPASARLDA